MSLNPKKKRRYPFKRILNRKIRRIIFMIILAALASGISYYKKHHGEDKELVSLNPSVYIFNIE